LRLRTSVPGHPPRSGLYSPRYRGPVTQDTTTGGKTVGRTELSELVGGMTLKLACWRKVFESYWSSLDGLSEFGTAAKHENKMK